MRTARALLIVLMMSWHGFAQAQSPPNNGSLMVPNSGTSTGGGSGTVTSISTSCGLGGGPITSAGTISGQRFVNAQTGTTYTFNGTGSGGTGASPDCGELITFSNAGAVAATLPQAGSTGFAAGTFMVVQNRGAGSVTITPTTSTINGAATLVLATNVGYTLVSDGTNWQISGSVGSSYTAAANGGLSLSGSAFSLGDGVGISYTSPGQLGLIGGTVTTNSPLLSGTETWNGSGVVFTGYKINITDTSSSLLSGALEVEYGGSTYFRVGKSASGYAALWLLNGVTPTASNAVFQETTGSLYVQAPGGAGSILNLGDTSGAYITINNVSTRLSSTEQFGFTSGASGATIDTPVTRHTAAWWQFGAADAAAPVAQTIGAQSVVAGTSNTVGSLWTIADSAGSGNQASGGFAWQTHPLGSSGTQQNPAVTKMALSPTGDFTLSQYVSCTTLATNASGQLTCNGSVP